MAVLNACASILGRIAPVAQLDRAPGYEPGGREFESLRAHHQFAETAVSFVPDLFCANAMRPGSIEGSCRIACLHASRT